MGSVFSTRRRTAAVQPVASSSAASGDVTAVGSTDPDALWSLITGTLRPVRRKRCDQGENEEQDEIRQRDEDEAPVNVGSRRVHWQPPCVGGVSNESVRGRAHCLEG